MKDFQTLQKLRALRDDARAPQAERDAAAEALRRRLAAAGISEAALDGTTVQRHYFLVPSRGKGRTLFIHIASVMLDVSPLPCYGRQRTAGKLQQWTLECTLPQSIDITDCYAHYAGILNEEQAKLDAEKKAARQLRDTQLKLIERATKEKLKEIAVREGVLLEALIFKYGLVRPSRKRGEGEKMNGRDFAAAIANAMGMTGEAWARKLSGDPQRTLPGGQLQLGFEQ